MFKRVLSTLVDVALETAAGFLLSYAAGFYEGRTGMDAAEFVAKLRRRSTAN